MPSRSGRAATLGSRWERSKPVVSATFTPAECSRASAGSTPGRLAQRDVDGTGGIGFLIDQSIKLFPFDQMLTQILIVLILLVIVDQLPAYVRRRIRAD
jgi:hypothetical protein